MDKDLTHELTDEERDMFEAVTNGGYVNGRICLMSTNFNGVATPTICNITQEGNEITISPLYVMVAGNKELLKKLVCKDGTTPIKDHDWRDDMR